MVFDYAPIQDTPSIENLANQCVERAKGLYLEWYDALLEGKLLCEEQGLDSFKFLKLIDHVRDAQQLKSLMQILRKEKKLYPYEKNGVDWIFTYAYDSDYPLEEWLEAIEFFYTWFKCNLRTGNFLGVLAYIEASIEGAKNNHLPQKNLKSIVEATLNQFCYNE